MNMEQYLAKKRSEEKLKETLDLYTDENPKRKTKGGLINIRKVLIVTIQKD